MQQEGYNPQMAVSALETLAQLGGDASFLSSHPAPESRAERLRQRIENPGGEVKDKGFMEHAWDFLRAGLQWILSIVDKVLSLVN